MEHAGTRPRDPKGSTEAADASENACEDASESEAGPPEARARPRARAARLPQQRGVADGEAERGVAADVPHPAREEAARGEHTHSEPPIPRPRVEERPSGEGRPSEGLLPAVESPLPRARPVVQRSSVRGQILDALRAALVAGELTPGEVYSAPALGEGFGVSATPVREAMQQLALEGAVEVVPNRGFRVVERGARELAELAEIRALIEIPVVLRLARTLPAECWAELRPLAEETARAAASGCRATYGEADRAFHRALLGLAGNEQLVGIADDLHRRSQWPLGGEATGRCRTGLMADAAVHLALLDALTVQDLDAVRALLQEHFGGV